MKAKYVQRGDLIDYTPTEAVAAGDVVILGDFVGVALRDIAANKLGALQTSGIFDFLKVAGEMTAGTLLYWNTSVKKATITAGAYKYIGKVIADAADADTNVLMKLNAPGIGATGADGADGADGAVPGGSYTADADDDTAGTLDIVTGLSSVSSFNVQIRRAGVDVTADAVLTEADGTITVADGAATYSITDGDVIAWLATGTV